MSMDLAHLMSSVAKMALRTSRRMKENEKEKEQTRQQKQFEYAGAVNDDMLSEMAQAVQTVEEVFAFDKNVNPKRKVAQLEKVVCDMIETQEIPSVYDEDIEMVAIDLGIYFGYLLHSCYDWQWLMLGDSEEDSMLSIVSPSGHYHLEPTDYLLDVLLNRREKHITNIFNQLGKLK